MDTDGNPKTDTKKSIVASNKLKTILGGVAIAVCAVLAGFVYSRYEVGIPPAEAAPTSAKIAKDQFIHVTVAEQSPAIHAKAISKGSRLAASAGKVPMIVGGMCSLDEPATS